MIIFVLIGIIFSYIGYDLYKDSNEITVNDIVLGIEEEYQADLLVEKEAKKELEERRTYSNTIENVEDLRKRIDQFIHEKKFSVSGTEFIFNQEFSRDSMEELFGSPKSLYAGYDDTYIYHDFSLNIKNDRLNGVEYHSLNLSEQELLQEFGEPDDTRLGPSGVTIYSFIEYIREDIANGDNLLILDFSIKNNKVTDLAVNIDNGFISKDQIPSSKSVKNETQKVQTSKKSGSVNEISIQELESTISTGGGMFVYFYNPTSVHSQNMTQNLSGIVKEMDSSISQIDVSVFKDAWDQYGLEAVPTLIYFENNMEVNRLVGAAQLDVTKQFIKSNQ